MTRRTAALALVLAASLAWLVQPAAATPPRPAELHVNGGDSWHAEPSFSLAWTDPPTVDPPLTLAHYRIRTPGGSPIEQGLGNPNGGILALVVPPVPGSYTTEVWFEDSAGTEGPAATVQLRFDDSRPAPTAFGPIPAWIGRTGIPLRVHLGHPLEPLPLAGIRGYAFAVDNSPNGFPCAGPDRCGDAETTLRGGIDADTATLAELPEGSSYLHAVAVSGSGMRSTSTAHAVLHVDKTDPVTTLSGAPSGWTNQAVLLNARAVDAGSGMTRIGNGPQPYTAIRIDGGAAAIGLGEAVTANVIAEGAHPVEYFARDAAGNVNDGSGQNGIANHSPRSAWVRIDRAPPTVAFANSQDPHDPDLVRVRVSDPLSGPDLTRGQIGVRVAGSGDRFEPLAPEPPGEGELRARWDSDAHSKIEYEFRAIGYDAAGNRAVATRRRDGTAMILANPLKATTALGSSFRHGRMRRTVRYGRRLLVHGRLTTGLDTPLANAPVRILERFAAGAQPAARTTTIRTRADGTFAVGTAPGPSRTIAVAFPGTPTLARATSQPLALRVRSRVHLRTSARVARVGGAPLVFRGRVAAAAGATPPDGISVQLQFRLPGLPWSEFRTIDTDRRGRFRLAYRFSDDDSRGARFQFRAYVSAQESWPYEPAGSKPLFVRGI